MFPWILVVILNAGTPKAEPIAVAGFRDQATCEAVAQALRFEPHSKSVCAKGRRT
jgi:hypothetical protein